jgi:hypothetical protein
MRRVCLQTHFATTFKTVVPAEAGTHAEDALAAGTGKIAHRVLNTIRFFVNSV